MRGEVHKTATVMSNDPTNPNLTLELTGKVVALLDVQPQDKFLINTFRNEAKQQEITIVNNDAKPMTITKIENNNKNLKTELKTIRPGKEYKLVVDIDTTAIGKSESVINVQTDHPKFPNVPINFSVMVRTLVGAIPTEVRFGNLKLDALKASPSAMTTRSVIVRKSKDGKDFKIEKVEAEGSMFKVETESVSSGLGIGGYRIKVQLDLEKIKAGDSLESTLTIKTNDKETPELKIPVHGKIV